MAEAPLSPNTMFSSSHTSVMLDHKCSSILSTDIIRDIEKAWKEGKLLEVVSVVRKTETVSRMPVSIAVTGESGNGMSSFINALRRLKHEDEDSAPIGVVKTTQTRGSYSSFHFPNVVLWDLPGLGTTAQSLENYLNEMQFSQYDLFIIIASEQFSMNHVKLAKAIQGMGKRFYVVWTKLDRDFSTSALLNEKILQNIQEKIKENLQNEGVKEPPIFLVSNFDPSLHDFPKLRNTLRIDISKIRYHSAQKIIFSICEDIINENVTSLLNKIDTGGFQDVLGIQDPNNLGDCLKSYRFFFGVDDKSLKQVAQSIGKSVEEYTNIVKSQDAQTYHQESSTLSWIGNITVFYFCIGLSYIPYYGNSVAKYLNYMEQRRLLESVAKDTKTILRKVLEDFINLDEVH
ncbi:immunity-related GTPase family M protein-like [Ictidomys tridecemlineatus]|uniref:immunity-related GTPase family M protein-like n=1 Tax=Ictidomys tridecemlineatus TaxID=43179 RepID=UPI00038BEF1F|nr:immunity-related GTPase family M protein-like [Ictidomys tridecemlineatus]XP_040128931.1 immunity-related GTPase family M protein-like [Ictidomys tridecemlineatus]KAG3265589.1 immunity-related GTPase family M protein-like [Ictidomys tridecemlineatus]